MALRCDLIIRDATIFDGTGAPRQRGDVGVTGDRIVAVGDLGGYSADREVIAKGKALEKARARLEAMKEELSKAAEAVEKATQEFTEAEACKSAIINSMAGS